MHEVDFIGSQQGRVAVVTGANSGIGFQTALALAQHGAHVVLACRNRERAQEAAALIDASSPTGSTEILLVDLASLSSVRSFAVAFKERHERLDLLIDNAAVMLPPRRELTVDGFELQMGTNHLGHFALTGLLIDRAIATEGSRIVVVTSLCEHFRGLDFAELSQRTPAGLARYGKYSAYCRSKLANLLFAFELARRVGRLGRGPRVAAAHVGISDTRLQRHSRMMGLLFGGLGMKPEDGARPVLYAATAEAVEPGAYYGPGRLAGLRPGPLPKSAWASGRARDEALAEQLWEASVELTGVHYEALDIDEQSGALGSRFIPAPWTDRIARRRNGRPPQ